MIPLLTPPLIQSNALSDSALDGELLCWDSERSRPMPFASLQRRIGRLALLRTRLDHQTGPTAIARLWSAVSALPPELQCQVIERGDRGQSPPACLRGGDRA